MEQFAEEERRTVEAAYLASLRDRVAWYVAAAEQLRTVEVAAPVVPEPLLPEAVASFLPWAEPELLPPVAATVPPPVEPEQLEQVPAPAKKRARAATKSVAKKPAAKKPAAKKPAKAKPTRARSAAARGTR
jgi:hypothetical protein